MVIQKNKFGFTLVEMLIVIVIIGILAAALIPRLGSVKEKASDAGRKTALAQVATALQIYAQDNNTYPSTAGSFDVISGMLNAGGLEIIPDDKKNGVSPCGINTNISVRGTGYGYLPISKTSIGDNKAFVVFACPKSPSSANWVYCGGVGIANGEITGGTTNTIVKNNLCDTVSQGTLCANNAGACTYVTGTSIRYIMVYP